MENIEVIIFGGAMYAWIALILFFACDWPEGGYGELNLPKLFYNKGMNWFGALFTTIIYSMFNPIGTAIRIVWGTCVFIKWLFTVGR